MICCSSKIHILCAIAYSKCSLGVVAMALFVCMMLSSCRTKRSATSAVVTSATIGTMETTFMDSSCKVIQWDVYVTDSMKDTASWVPMVRKTIATKRQAITYAHTDAVIKDTAAIMENSVPHGARATNAEKDIMQLSPLQLLLYRIGLIVCIFGLFFGISYLALAYFRKNA